MALGTAKVHRRGNFGPQFCLGHLVWLMVLGASFFFFFFFFRHMGDSLD